MEFFILAAMGTTKKLFFYCHDNCQSGNKRICSFTWNQNIKLVSSSFKSNWWLFLVIKYCIGNFPHWWIVLNCFCSIVDRRKAFSLLSSQDHCQRSSPSQISDTLQAGFKPAQNLSWDSAEWSFSVAITIAPRGLSSERHCAY